ncbi:GIN domain-containing protein [Flavobacterium muglaense]|uniref:DUF2807 domain-containing protein n=1 Tax=Flavobacterium muglaense TaxID=2764716 RepID=A0A923MWW3_9FLAO|nr:DUF2807 domain-containing protein [Flavobacterium muglaense]MBC5837263.1 DUF2807 domain-containing protein [Flavobacterium muglaense]MBC5843813.1 DUF2807 domain-containing protein [Flavobacterium muglaense]
MKKHFPILLLLLVTTATFAQSREKTKGSKNVTTLLRNIGAFKTIEIDDNIEAFLEVGDIAGIKIEADGNLHDIISTDVVDNVLNIHTLKDITRFKKLQVRITYTKDLNLVSLKNEATVNAIQQIQLDSIAFKSYGDSKLFLNINSKHFRLESNDKSKVELNLTSDKAKLILSQNATLKALVKTTDLTADLYQKTDAKIEGTATNGVLRTDSDSKLNASKLTIKNIKLVTEGSSEAAVNAETTITITASGKSEIDLYGDPAIEMKKFADEAKLIKKVK